MKNYPTLRQLQYLQALKQHGSFGKAAAACHVTQPTLSAGIKELENILGLAVLKRQNTKQTEFTEFGKEVLTLSHKIFDPLNDILDRAKTIQKPLSGIFKIGMIPTIAPYLLPVLLPQLRSEFPDMIFEVTENTTQNLLNNLQNDYLDLLILALPYDLPGTAQETLFEESFYCVAPKKTFQSKKISFKDLQDHTILLLEDGHCLREHALAACKLQNKDDERALSATSLNTLVQMVAHGYGLTLLPEMALEIASLRKDVGVFEFTTPTIPKRKIGLCCRENRQKNANIKAVRQFLKKTLKK